MHRTGDGTCAIRVLRVVPVDLVNDTRPGVESELLVLGQTVLDDLQEHLVEIGPAVDHERLAGDE